MFPEQLLKDQHIFITGVSGLLGSQIAKYCKQAGAKVTGLDLRPSPNLEINFISCDLCNLKQVNKVLTNLDQELLHGWVNAAYPRTADWGDKKLSPESWGKNIEMQLTKVCLINEKVAQIMRCNQNGSIVNMASIYGILGPQFEIYNDTDMTMPAPYAAIKGGIINYTRFMASKYGADNLRINCVSPGGIEDAQPKSFIENYSEKTMLKRMGRPEEIASIIAFLLSDQATYITGQNIVVDGGWSAM